MTKEPRTMKRPYQITSVLFILLSLFIIREAVELKYYTSLGPGPGFFPMWLAGIFGTLSAFMFYHATWGKSDPMSADFFAKKSGYLRNAAILLALLFMIFTLEVIGFRLSMLAFLGFLLFALGRANIIATILVALAGSWGVFHVFVEWLKVPLPTGIFGF